MKKLSLMMLTVLFSISMLALCAYAKSVTVYLPATETEIYKNSSDEVSKTVIKYKYSVSKLKVNETWNNGTSTGTAVHTFNKKGQLTSKKETFGSDGVITMIRTSKYDKFGRVTKDDRVRPQDPGRNDTYTYKFSDKYDAKKVLVSADETTSAKSTGAYLKHHYQYYTSGSCKGLPKSCVNEQLEDGKWVEASKTTYTYKMDKNKNIKKRVEVVTFDDNSTCKYDTTYTYKKLTLKY